MTPTEVVQGVHRIDAEVGGRPLYLFLFLGDRNLLLDAGLASTVGDSIVPALDGLGLRAQDLDMLVITHPDLDHQGGARALRSANPSLLVTCGVLDMPLVSDPDVLSARRYDAYRADHAIAYDTDTLASMRLNSGAPEGVDIGWAGGELLRLAGDWQLRVLHVPGHSPGHVALFDERSQALFSADSVQGSVYLGLDGTRKLPPTYTHVDPYLQTVATIEALAPRSLHGSHWPAHFGDEVGAFLAETRDYVDDLDRLVRDSLDEPLTLKELVARTNSRLDQPWPEDLAGELVYSVHGHAGRLVERGLATAERGPDGVVVYRPAA
jgi:glyoxylase-like metal-dependent hydrolase (beta-lactamase superfamily II)